MPNGDKVGRGVLSAIEELFHLCIHKSFLFFYAFSLSVVLICYTCAGVIWNNFAVDEKYHKELIVSESLSGSWLTVSWRKGQRL